MLVLYTHERLTYEKPIMVDQDFVPFMEIYCQVLADAGCKAHINRAFDENSDHIVGAIVPPAKKSCHFIGCAIDANIIDQAGHTWSHSEMEHATDEVLEVIQRTQELGLRWGGTFIPADTVHWDNDLWHKNRIAYMVKYNEYHQAA